MFFNLWKDSGKISQLKQDPKSSDSDEKNAETFSAVAKVVQYMKSKFQNTGELGITFFVVLEAKSHGWNGNYHYHIFKKL